MDTGTLCGIYKYLYNTGTVVSVAEAWHTARDRQGYAGLPEGVVGSNGAHLRLAGWLGGCARLVTERAWRGCASLVRLGYASV